MSTCRTWRTSDTLWRRITGRVKVKIQDDDGWVYCGRGRSLQSAWESAQAASGHYFAERHPWDERHLPVLIAPSMRGLRDTR